MRPVRVNKAQLLEKLRANRDAHHGIFVEALEGYRAKAIEVFNQELDKVRNGKSFRSYVQLQEPEDHTRDYDRVIGMLELSEDDVVELDEQSYVELVQDDWAWKRQFIRTNAAYSARAARLLEPAPDEPAPTGARQGEEDARWQ